MNLIFDDFDYGRLDAEDWAEIQGGSVRSGFTSGAHSLFFGAANETGQQRFAESAVVDISTGGTVSFDLIFGTDFNGGNNASPDQDVVLEYSTDGGTTWAILETYDTEDYANWSTPIIEDVPAEGLSNATQFRWRQQGTPTPGTNNWALDDVTLTNTALASQTSIFDDFDYSRIDPGIWADIKGGTVRSGLSSGAHTLFFGSPSDGGGQRSIESVPMDVRDGGTVSFELKFGNGLNGGENADPGKDVVLEYSTDRGDTWVRVNTYDSEDYSHWRRINEDVPDAALSDATRFRLRQVSFDVDSSATTGLDNWGLNDFGITNTPLVAQTNIFDDFDYSTIDGEDWVDIKGGTVRSGFSSGAHTLFFGSSNDEGGQRLIESVPMDVNQGGIVSFNLIFGDGLNGGDNADPDEDVVLEYSIDDGENWVLVDTYDSEDYTHWTRVNAYVPDEGLTSSTSFRLRQLQFDADPSETGVDNWGLNDFSITGAPIVSPTEIFDNFDYSTPDTDDWADIKGGSVRSGFSSGAHTLFFGSSGDEGGQRLIESIPMDVSAGGTVSFEIIFGDDLNGGENANPGEDVVLEYSVDDGENWVPIKTYDTEDYTHWTRINQDVPEEALTSDTRFRLRQLQFDLDSSATGVDNWGLNDFGIVGTGVATQTSLFDNFDYGRVDADDWVGIQGGSIRSGFSSGAHTVFFGSSSDGGGQRLIESVPVNVRSGGTVSFEIIFGDGFNGGEDADPGEDVVLEYSIDDGENWVLINTYGTEDYTSWTEITENIPAAASTGNTKFRLRQIAFDQVNTSENGEDNWGLNDFAVTPSITAIPPDVDLVVDSVTTATTEALFGEDLEISWVVRNQGTEATTTSWRDRIYLSTDETLSTEDITLGEVFPNTTLAADATYSQITSVNLPLDTDLPDDDYYILVRTDDLDNQAETTEINNLGTLELSISNPPSSQNVDLVVDANVLPDRVFAGESLTISWTVSNQGTIATTTGWNDRIYLSTDETLSNDDISLGEFSQNTSLAANEAYSKTESVSLPLDAELSDGNYYILVKTDDLDNQVESNETNNVGTVEVSISNPTPSRNVDLVVDVNVSPDRVLAGETLDVEWIVKNQGTDSTGVVWFDKVYLSLDDVLSFDDIPLTSPRTIDSSFGLFKNKKQLSPGETYRYEDEFSIPSNFPVGTYYLLVETDGIFIEFETNEDNNVGFDRFSVIESHGPTLPTGTLRGTSWNDLNGDGLRNSNEPGLSGVRIYLDFNNNGSLDINEPWLSTDEFGNYEFSNLLPGNYNVREIIPEGFIQTVPQNHIGLDFYPITSLSGGQVIHGIDFGNRQLLDSRGPGVIRGIKWNDLDGNGFQSFNEPGLPGVKIYLDLNQNEALDPDEPMAVTNQAGEYEFRDLPSGIIYHIREIVPPGFIQTYPFFPGTISGDSFADEVIQFSNGGQQKLGGTAPSLDTPPEEISIVAVDNTDAVLGNDSGEVDFLVIPKDASITVGFDDEITFDRPGNDIFITEYADKAEEAEVFVSSDGVNFELLGEAKGGQTTGLDLADIGFTGIVRAIKIVALNDGTGTPGFELANVEVQNGLVPQPDFHTVYVGNNGIHDNINFGNFSESEKPPEDDGMTPGTDPGEEPPEDDGATPGTDPGEEQGPPSIIPGTPEEKTRSKGEPHLTTFDGVGYSFQGAGEFTLVESLNDDFNVQVRYVEIDSRATVASAVATIVDGQRVEIDSEGIEFVEGRPIVTRSTSGETATVSIDGEVVEIPDNGDLDIGSSKIYRRGGQYTIVYAGENGTIEDGDDQLVVNYLRPGTINIVDVFLGDEKKGQVQGLGGNLNDNPDDDVALPDGTPLARPLQFSELYGDYRDAWRIKNREESLFDYEDGQGPDTFYNPNFPAAPFSFDDLDPDIQARAIQVAFEAGYIPGTFEFDSAAFDFAITKDSAFLEGADTDPGADESLSIVDDRPDLVPQLPNFTGAEVELQIFYPDLQSPLAEPLIVTVNDEVEAISSDFNVRNLVEHSLDISSNSIVYEVGPSAGSGNSGSGSFNGYVINDVFDILPDFTNVSINEANNTRGLEPNDVTFTENTIYINFEGLSYSPGQTVELNIDFAEIALGNSAIEGLVFDDRNANSIQDIGETGLAGVTVFLDENQNGQFDPDEPSQATDSSGEYRFTGLVPGSYNVRQITPSGYEQTYPFTQTSIGDGFADRVLDYFDSGAGPQPGPYGSGGVNFTENVVLGDRPSTFLSLPTGSSVTVSFEDEVIVDGPGDDIFILEEGSAREEAHVYVSSDLTTFTLLGIADGGTTTSLDLEDINFNQPVRAVKIVGLDNSGRSPGFDVASVRGLPDSIIMAPDFHAVSLQPGETVSSLNFGNRAVADGSFIQPDTAVASSEFSSSYQATYTIDGSGLSDPLLGSNAIHDLYRPGNHWTSAGTAPRDQLIDWGFTTPKNLDEMYIWNHQSTVGPAVNTGYDVTLFDLTLFDAADNILLTLDDVALQPDTNAAQTFSFGQTVANVSRVRFEIEDVQSSTNYTGLAEVGFRGV